MYYTGARKLASLVFDHEDGGLTCPTSTMMNRGQQVTQPCWTPTMSATAATINEYVSIYLLFGSIASIASLTVYLTHVCLFVSLNSPLPASTMSTRPSSTPPSATGTPQQQLQPEHYPTMTMAIMKCKQKHSNKTRNGNGIADQQAT